MKRKILILLALLLCGCVPESRYRRPYAYSAYSHNPYAQAPVYPTSAVPMSMVDELLAQRPYELLSVEAWFNDYAPGLVMKTSHYEIHTTITKTSLLCRIASHVEAAHSQYSRSTGTAGVTSARSKVYLFANRAQWESFTRKFAGNQAHMFVKIQEGAYCHNDSCVLYDIGVEKTLAAISHEGWHQFASRNFVYRLPSWLDEGIAMQFENMSWSSTGSRIDVTRNPYRLNSLRRIVNSHCAMRLTDLLSSSPGQVMASDRTESVAAFYSQSYALVRFLQEAGNAHFRVQYDKMVRDGLYGLWNLTPEDRRIASSRQTPRTLEWNSRVGRQLFEQYISASPESLERAYTDFCRAIVGQ
ncbi:MAG: DUF1570 domain-containing protein [Planctomycetes bacterium]|nr:DUF1570 domain-containing protein [Planctomycetota bacterium]